MLLDTAAVGKGFALWLIPEEPIFSLLAREICRLSRLHSTPMFDPHITLLGGILLPEEEALAKATLSARCLKPFKVKLGEIGYLDEYFRCLFVKVVPSSPIMQAYQAACEAFGKHGDSSFVPHISLMYGEIPVRSKKGIAARVGWLSGLTCDIRRLILYRVSGPTENWRPIKEFTLGQDFPRAEVHR